MQVVFMGEPVSADAQERFWNDMKNNGLVPEDGGVTIQVQKPEVVAEVARMHDALNGGARYDDVVGNASPDAQRQFSAMERAFGSGQNIVLVDRDLSYGIIAYPGEKLQYFNFSPHH